MGEHGDGVGLTTENRQMDTVQRHASIVFQELCWKGDNVDHVSSLLS
jgi:hypothetical protein